MRPHQKLEVWIKALELVIEIYRRTEGFPREERYGLTSQIRRAAVSIPANVAEGAGRQSKKDFARDFFQTLKGLRVNWLPRSVHV